MFKCKNEACPKPFEKLFTLKSKNKYQLKRSCTLLGNLCKSKFSQLCINYCGQHLCNKIVFSQNTDLEQSTTQKFFKENLRLIFSLLTMLHFYFDIVLYTKIKISHKELIIWLLKWTPNSKISDGSGDKIVNDLLPVPIIHQTCLKAEIALLIQDHIEKLFSYDKVEITNASIIYLSFYNYFPFRLMLIEKQK